MPATVRPLPSRLGSPRPSSIPPPQRARRPFRDNPRLILVGIILLLAALAGILAIARGSVGLSPDFLSEFVLYALSAADLTMLVALIFVLARNIVKLVVERRRALPFARFRAKLVAALLGMTLIPAVLVLIVGSELIRNSVDRWFNAPMDDVLTSASAIASDYYHERQVVTDDAAARVAGTLSGIDLATTNVTTVGDLLLPEITQRGVQMIQVYRVIARPGLAPDVAPVVDMASPSLPPGHTRAVADRLAARAAAGGENRTRELLSTGGELIRTAAVVRRPNSTVSTGVIVVSDYLTSELATRARRITDAYEDYNQLRVLKRPLAGVYLSFFVMVTLMILVSATWMGLYLAKRITQPVQKLATAAREIEAGHLDHRVERETANTDEFGLLIDAFNSMAGELARNRRRLERSTVDLERKHIEGETRRRYIETIMERVATGVVSVDGAGQVSTVNTAAARLLAIEAGAVGRSADALFGRPDLAPIDALLRGASRGPSEPVAQDVVLARDGREIHLAAVATALQGQGGASEGLVLVLDDVTPLIRAQKVAAWREVARRLAHEIKNPLTPIQLCAERLNRHFGSAPEATRALVDECTRTIIGEVESLKALVDEFSQFARMPAPKAVPTDLQILVNDTLALYNGLLGEVRVDRRFASHLPLVRVDSEQVRRVIINLVDNAVEAMNRRGAIVIETQYDPAAHLARIVVADSGPGISAAERDKLFLPYYSTKRRGSGLGLAIVRRIVAEHGGSIEVTDNVPHGTRFTIELPC
jgi:two-component system, NtrC family, nitrogen regulation sensor histidine kinase NtrY